MLSLIRIRNYAVIDELELEFGSGLSVLTGETGAGKSILVDALGLALGDRADANTVRKGKKRAEICVTFDCPDNHPALMWLSEHELDEEQACMIRRTISAEGRSRAFINNQPVTLQDLRNLGASLVEIHGQHAHQSLLQKVNQRRILDFHGKHQPLLESVSQLFENWQKLKTKLDDSRRGIEDREEQLEFLRNQEKTLVTLSLEDGEVNQLQTEHGRVANIEHLAAGINQSLEKLYEGEIGSAHTLIASSQRILQSLAELDPELKENLALLNGVEIDIREIATGLSRYRDQLDMDPQRLEWIETRIAKIRELARRYKVEEIQLETLLTTVAERIQEIEQADESLASLENNVGSAADLYYKAAEELSKARKKSAISLGKSVSSQLKDLGLPHGQFCAALTQKTNEYADANGLDQVEFQISLNPGQPLGPLAQMASGGELSRISLALEVVGTGEKTVTTMVFDEVDAGIGGSVAEIVGRRLEKIGVNRQVLCVTHLAQVASQGQHHYRVSKLTDGQTSITKVRLLADEEKLEELSRMLGGIEITERTRAHAAEMMARSSK